MIHLGVTDVGEGLCLERMQRLLGRKLSRLYPPEQFQSLPLFHFRPFSGGRPDDSVFYPCYTTSSEKMQFRIHGMVFFMKDVL